MYLVCARPWVWSLTLLGVVLVVPEHFWKWSLSFARSDPYENLVQCGFIHKLHLIASFLRYPSNPELGKMTMVNIFTNFAFFLLFYIWWGIWSLGITAQGKSYWFSLLQLGTIQILSYFLWIPRCSPWPPWHYLAWRVSYLLSSELCLPNSSICGPLSSHYMGLVLSLEEPSQPRDLL